MTALNVDVKRKYFTEYADPTNQASFICTADRNTKDIVRLRSYSLPDEPNTRATIC
jgi:hypothetical protein